MTNYPIVILSGGVSKGKFDFIPGVMEKLGVQKLFHKIKQRPGKPFWFGKAPNNTVIFALPGNPVSSFMCTHRYIRPWLQKSLNLPPIAPIYGILEEEIYFKPDLTYFMQVKLSYTPNGTILAKPVEGHGSGDLANLVDADAFMELPKGANIYKAGEVHPIILYRPFNG